MSGDASTPFDIGRDLVAEWDRDRFQVETGAGVSVVEFYLRWAVQSATQLGIYLPLAMRLHGQASFGRVEVQRCAQLASAHRVTSVPTLIVFKNGEEFGRLVGLQPADVLERWVRALL